MPSESRIEQLLRRWKEAEQAAREAELLLYRGYADSAAGKGPGPTDRMKEDATALRSLARSSYHAAMAEVDRILDEADKRTRWP